MPEQDTEILVSAGKGARLQCALDKQAAFSVKGVLPRQVPHPRQSSVIFCEQLLQQDLHRRSVWPLPAFLISCKDEVEECSLCHDLSDDAQLLWLFLVTDTCWAVPWFLRWALPAAVLTVQSSASCRQHLDYFSLDAFPCIYLCWKVTDLPFFCSLIHFCEVSLKYFSIIVALDCPKLLVYLVLLALGLLFLVLKYIFYNIEWNSTGWKGISCCCWWQ